MHLQVQDCPTYEFAQRNLAQTGQLFAGNLTSQEFSKFPEWHVPLTLQFPPRWQKCNSNPSMMATRSYVQGQLQHVTKGIQPWDIQYGLPQV